MSWRYKTASITMPQFSPTSPGISTLTLQNKIPSVMRTLCGLKASHRLCLRPRLPATGLQEGRLFQHRDAPVRETTSIQGQPGNATQNAHVGTSGSCSGHAAVPAIV